MVGGQVDDLAWEGKSAETGRRIGQSSDLEAIHARKTGALFRVSLRLGLLAAQGECGQGGPDRRFERCSTTSAAASAWRFRSPTICSTSRARPTQTGKRVGKDAARGKLTYPGSARRRRKPATCARICARASRRRPWPSCSVTATARAAVRVGFESDDRGTRSS